MAARKAWNQLSPAYRERLERHGVTRETHVTTDKTGARGHPTPAPVGSVSPSVINPLLEGEGSPQDFTTLLNKFTWPDWVPREVSTTRYGGAEPVFVEVAAALSQLPNPRLWVSAHVEPQGDGEPWTMTVKLKGNRYDRTILIPGGGQEFSGGRQVLGILTELRLEDEEKARRRAAAALWWEVTGTP